MPLLFLLRCRFVDSSMCSVGLCTAIAIAMLDAHTYNRTVELLGDVQRKGQPAGIPLERTKESSLLQ